MNPPRKVNNLVINKPKPLKIIAAITVFNSTTNISKYCQYWTNFHVFTTKLTKQEVLRNEINNKKINNELVASTRALNKIKWVHALKV